MPTKKCNVILRHALTAVIYGTAIVIPCSSVAAQPSRQNNAASNINQLTQLANQGDAEAQFKLAEYYRGASFFV